MYTLLSIGFGNIYPVNTGERVFATLVMIVGAFISTGIILSMRDLLETQNLQSKEIRSKSAEFLEYVEQKKIPYQLKMEAKSAYSYYLQRRPTVAESDIFDELPKHVFLKMVKNLYRLDIQAIRLFHSTDEFFMAQLIIYSKPHHAVVGDIIYGMEDVADEISFVTRGAVGI
jgi:predicted transcriptional regulator